MRKFVYSWLWVWGFIVAGMIGAYFFFSALGMLIRLVMSTWGEWWGFAVLLLFVTGAISAVIALTGGGSDDIGPM